MKKKVLIIVLIAVFVLTGVCVWYVNDYYRAENRSALLADTDSVTVTETDFGYSFDGPGESTALIFYPGAKVEDAAYAGLLKRVAEGGTDCFLVHMPCNLAFLGQNKADAVMSEYDYDEWYLAGHSLGGAMAAVYAERSSEKLCGLIFLAAYPTKDLSETGLRVLSIYGYRDGIVNMEKIEQGRVLMPETYEEFIIEGGNHAGFGDYGRQKGDGEAALSGDEQKAVTAAKILEMITDEGE